MAGKAMWRRAYDAVERPIGSRLEEAVQTEQFAEVAGLLVHVRAGLSRQVERATRHALHRVNLPAASDVARLREQVSSLERTVRNLDDAVRRGAIADAPPAARRASTPQRTLTARRAPTTRRGSS